MDLEETTPTAMVQEETIPTLMVPIKETNLMVLEEEVTPMVLLETTPMALQEEATLTVLLTSTVLLEETLQTLMVPVRETNPMALLEEVETATAPRIGMMMTPMVLPVEVETAMVLPAEVETTMVHRETTTTKYEIENYLLLSCNWTVSQLISCNRTIFLLSCTSTLVPLSVLQHNFY